MISNPRRIWLRSFYGFSPEDDGYIGWTDEAARDRMLNLVEDDDIFMIYGAGSPETDKLHRNRVIGFLQIRAECIRDIDKSSTESIRRKHLKGWQDKWTHALSVARAWRVDEPILLERIARKTYRPESGQAIALWSPPLIPEEIELALKIRVTEVRVFGEPPLRENALVNTNFSQIYRPSRAFPGSFGERISKYEDGPTYMYLARFDGNGYALLGQEKPRFDKKVLIKIGISNDKSRRVLELNSGFPPASVGKWTMQVVSEMFECRKKAELAEQEFKDKAQKQLQSLGGEFFLGEWMSAQSIFATIPGVSRFGS